MSKTCVFIFAAFLILLVVGDDSLTTEYPEKPGYCRMQNVYIKEGETGPAPIGRCMRMKCKSAEPGKIVISGVGCAKHIPAPGCHMSPYDNTKPYPHCCPKSICDEQK